MRYPPESFGEVAHNRRFRRFDLFVGATTAGRCGTRRSRPRTVPSRLSHERPARSGFGRSPAQAHLKARRNGRHRHVQWRPELHRSNVLHRVGHVCGTWNRSLPYGSQPAHIRLSVLWARNCARRRWLVSPIDGRSPVRARQPGSVAVTTSRRSSSWSVAKNDARMASQAGDVCRGCDETTSIAICAVTGPSTVWSPDDAPTVAQGHRSDDAVTPSSSFSASPGRGRGGGSQGAD
jgi:hypothetical protein